MALLVKNLSNDAEDVRDAGSITALGRSSGGGHGNPLQYSCLEHLMDRGAWRATVHEIAKIWTQLKQLSIAHCTRRWGPPDGINVMGLKRRRKHEASLCIYIHIY